VSAERDAEVPALAVRGVTKWFGGLPALQDVSLELLPGRIHALVGENGAGKSTLIKIAAGIHRPDEGTVELVGDPVSVASPAQAHRLGISVVHQEPALFPDLDVAENVLIGREPRTRWGGIDRRKMYETTEGLVAQLGHKIDGHASAASMAVADRQLLQIARALATNARVLILDEPTASLSPGEVARLFRIARTLKERGVAILFVTHRLDEVFELADSVTVLRNGRFVSAGPIEHYDTTRLIRDMIGGALEELYPDDQQAPLGPTALEVRNLTRAPRFYDVSFAVRYGEILGFSGLVGAGRTEVARVIFGIDHADSGQVLIDGQRAKIRRPVDAVRNGVAYVPEDRQHQGLALDFAIDQNITLPTLGRFTRLGLLRRSLENAVAREFVARLSIQAAGVTQMSSELSGGNQQKVLLAKWLNTDPRILILDEPTRGIDVQTKAEVHRIITRLASEGMAVVLISSDMPEVIALSSRVLVLYEGRITGEFHKIDATHEQLMLAATAQSPSALAKSVQ
jgi:rhamnose transport system ATP-binding protein